MRKIFFSVLIICSFLWSGFYPIRHAEASESFLQQKVEPRVLDSIHSSSLVPLIIELSEPCVVEYSAERILPLSFYTHSSSLPLVLDFSQEDTIMRQQNFFFQQLDSMHISYRANRENSCGVVINMVALDVKGTDISKLSSLSCVKQIASDEQLFFPTRYTAAQTTAAIQAWKGFKNVTGVTGKGIKVGILDTGLDVTHQDFQKRVKGGSDFADGDKDWNDTQGHGTHVAGIVAGRSETNPTYIGMAPDAFLYIYKVFPSGARGASSKAIVRAIEQSVKDKCDVINMSLGSTSGEPATTNEIYSTPIRNADKAGVMVTVSAGNAGSRGRNQKYSISYPSSVDAAFSVAATDDRSVLMFKAVSSEETRTIISAKAPFTPAFLTEFDRIPLVDCGIGTLIDIGEAGNIQGKIALIKRGQNTFREKHDNAKKAGAKAIIIYNNAGDELIAPSLVTDQEKNRLANLDLLPCCMVTQSDGEWLLESIGKSLSFNFSTEGGTKISSFSSQGAGSDGWFKPEIAAPGTDIISTVPKNTYEAYSGTSMSSPVVAGLVALVKEARPTWTNKQIRSAFMSTADIIMNYGNDLPVSFTLQGSGQAQVDKAMMTPAFIDPPALVIKRNEILPTGKSSSEPVEIVFTNANQSSNNFKISSEVYLLENEENPVTIEIDKTSFELRGSDPVKICVRFEVDRSLMKRTTYEGIIRANDLHIPFIIYRDQPNDEVVAISDISVTPEKLAFAKDTPVEEVEINFSLNSGLEASYSGGCMYDNYGNIYLSIIDEFGENWGTLVTLSGLLIGHYSIRWNGRNQLGNYILPKGKYHFEFDVINMKYKDNAWQYYADSYLSKGSLQVIESVVPDPGNMIVSVEKMLPTDEPFEVSLILEEAKDVSRVEFEFAYNGNNLTCNGVVDGGFFSMDGADVEIDEDIDDGNEGYGIISISRYANKDQPDGISGTHGRIARILFKPLDDGKMKIDFKNCKMFFSDGTETRLRFRGGAFRIKEEDEYLLCDLNGDNIVDKYDFKIFKDHYPSAKGEDDYNDDCDFNQDERVDLDDLRIFGKEYRKMI